MIKGIIDLLHEDITLGLAEICVIIPTKLIVTIHKVPYLIHEPLDLVHGADFISISIHDSQGHMADLVERNLSCLTLFVFLLIRFGKLLEFIFDTIL